MRIPEDLFDGVYTDFYEFDETIVLHGVFNLEQLQWLVDNWGQIEE